jgi:hypothetical protein
MSQLEADQDQAAYREGVFARALGRSADCNPYHPASGDGQLWRQGWLLIEARRDIPTPFAHRSANAPASQTSSETASATAEGRTKARRPRLFFLVHLAFVIAFGAFFLLMLSGVGRLTP